jgi:hypothetical protein
MASKGFAVLRELTVAATPGKGVLVGYVNKHLAVKRLSYVTLVPTSAVQHKPGNSGFLLSAPRLTWFAMISFRS